MREELMGRKRRSRRTFFERLKRGLEEGIAFAKGKIALRTVEIPNDPAEIDAEPREPSSTRSRDAESPPRC